MTTHTQHYTREQLALALSDQLGNGELATIERHLVECHACRQSLEQLAGDDSWWNDASVLLHVSRDDPPSYRRDASLSSITGPSTDSPAPLEFSLDFLERSDNPAMLGRLGDYEILELIGRGGMGVVLKGYQRQLNRYVAIKVMAPHYAHSSAARKRFVREAVAAAAVVHPHVAAIHGVDAEAKLPYLVMPFVACRSLQQIIDDDAPLELTEILRIAKQTAEGLAAAHAQGLVHRDIKPANILLEDEVGRVLLTDFGLARAIDDATMTQSGVLAGTPQYMSPEQAHGDPIDHRSDLFSLGSVLYAMATGHPPFRAETTMGILRRICEDDPRSVCDVNGELPPWFGRIVERLLAKDVHERFQSASELADLLEQCLAHVRQPAVNALPQSLTRPLSPSRSRFGPLALRVAVAGGATAMLAAAIFMLSRTDFSGPTPAATSPASVVHTDNTPPARPLSQHDSATPPWTDPTTTTELDSLEADLEQLEHESDSFWQFSAKDSSP